MLRKIDPFLLQFLSGVSHKNFGKFPSKDVALISGKKDTVFLFRKTGVKLLSPK